MDDDEIYKYLDDDQNSRMQCLLEFSNQEKIDILNDQSTLKSPYENDHEYIRMMSEMISPLDQIKNDFKGEIPIFSAKFLNELITFMLEDPDQGQELLDFLCYGPPQNLVDLPFPALVANFIMNMPQSIPLLCKILESSPDSCKYPLDFINAGGMSELIKYRDLAEEQMNIATIFYKCSLYPIKFKQISYDEYDPIDPDEIRGKSKGLSIYGGRFGLFSGLHQELTISEEENPTITDQSDLVPDDVLFREITETLMNTKNKEIVHLMLLSFSNIVDRDGDEGYQKIIANTVINFFKYFDHSTEFKTLSLQILSNTLNIFGAQIPPFNDIWGQVGDILRAENIEMTAALCTFVQSVVDKYHPRLIAGLEIFNEFIATANECTYNIKKPILSCLSYILIHSTEDEINEFVTPDVISLFLEFIEDTSVDDMADILRALTAIAKYTHVSDHLEQIGEKIDYLQELSQDVEEEYSQEAKELFDIMMSKKED